MLAEVGRQVAERWAKEEPDVLRNANQAELARMLSEIVRLSKVRLAHSANQDVPIKFFHTARDDHNNLRDVLLNAILDDCRTAFVDGVCACVRFVLACRWRLNGTERVVLAPVVTPWHAWRAQEGCRSGWVRTRRLDAALRSSRCPSSASILHAHGMGAAAAGWRRR